LSDVVGPPGEERKDDLADGGQVGRGTDERRLAGQSVSRSMPASKISVRCSLSMSAGDHGLERETLAQDRVGHELRQHHLERAAPPRAAVHDLVDDTHPAGRERSG